MTDECQRGRWNFVRGDGTKFVACQDYLGIGVPGEAAEFWATSEDGHAQVFRGPITYSGICQFHYFGGSFEIAFEVLGVVDLNLMSPEERKLWIEINDPFGAEYSCKIFEKQNASWIEAITQKQFEQFLADIKDPDLYVCLTECVPPINPPSKPWSYGYEKPSASFGSPTIPLAGESGFSFIGDWIENKISLPRAAAIQASLCLFEPVRKIKLGSQAQIGRKS